MQGGAVKNHENGYYHPKAHFKMKISIEQAMNAPMIADPLGRFDCCAKSDGSASLILSESILTNNESHFSFETTIYYFFLKFKAAELIQYLEYVGAGPSEKR